MSKEIKLIVSDIDGTILDDQHQISTELKRTVYKVINQGIPFVLASARSPKGMEQIATELGVENQPLASYNGALILKNSHLTSAEALFSHPMNHAEVLTILETLAKDFPTINVNLYSNADWYVNKMDKWAQLEADITQIQPEITDLKQFVDIEKNHVHKFLLIGEVSEIQDLMIQLKSLALSHSDFYLSKDNYLEITHTGISKARVVSELATFFNIEQVETMALGDNFNDLPMLKAAGLGVAMGNAPAEVKAGADVITTANTDNGVAQALKKYVLKKP